MNGIDFWNTVCAIAFGGVLGVFYDILRFLRRLVFKGKIFVFIFDIIFLSVSAVCAFLFAFATCSGNIRLIHVVFILSGFALYYHSWGALSVKLISFILLRLKRFRSKIASKLSNRAVIRKKYDNKTGKIKIYSSIFNKKNIK